MKTLLLCLVSACAFAQAPTFAVFRESTLAGAGEALTLQQPSSSAKDTLPQSAALYCSVACTVTLEINGTAASSTAGTVVDLLGQSNTSTTTAWVASDVGTGTTVAKYVIAAGSTYVVDLTGIRLRGSNTAKNMSLRVNSITGDFKALVTFRNQ